MEFAEQIIEIRKRVISCDKFPVDFRYTWGKVMLMVGSKPALPKRRFSIEEPSVPMPVNEETVTVSDGANEAAEGSTFVTPEVRRIKH